MCIGSVLVVGGPIPTWVITRGYAALMSVSFLLCAEMMQMIWRRAGRGTTRGLAKDQAIGA
jgi:hypothetical protein